jgi:hypothetical protein
MINLKLIAISATVALSIGFGGGLKAGLWWQQDTIDDLKQQHNEQLQAIENEAERDLKERQDQINHWQQEFAIADTNYQRTLKDAKLENDRLIACIDSGECVPTVEGESEVCSATGKDDNPKKTDGKERVRLSAKTAKDLVSIGHQDDEEALSCNELIEWVEIGIKSGNIKAEIL